MISLLELPLSQPLCRALDELGFHTATEVQAKAIPQALEGTDLLVSAKTGSGKTIAFLLPMLEKFVSNPSPKTSTRGLILLPTRELALQTQKTFEQLAKYTQVTCGLIMGGESYGHQVSTIRKNPEVFIATPGRLVEHIKNKNTDFSDLEFFVLDEADRMLDMGFTKEMNAIAEACRTDRQNLLFSATLQHKKLSEVSSILNNPISIKVDPTRAVPTSITQEAVLADDDKHKKELIRSLVAERAPRKVVVFCNTRAQCQQLGNFLKSKDLKASYIHGEIGQNDRKQILNQFRGGHVQILVATDLAARGLDIQDVDLVINFTVAQSGDDHLHRIGRTGRAEETGHSITLVNASEWNTMSSIERYLKFRFEFTVLKGLKANYTGPKKVKKSGKAAGTKTKKNVKKTAASKSKKKPVEKRSKTPANKVLSDPRFGSKN